MRIDEPIERSGYFWLPGNDLYKAPGTIRIANGGNISLEIVGTFSGPTGSMKDLQDDMSIGRIVGHIEKAGLVTLEDCFFTRRPYAFGGVTKSQITVNWAILGVAFDPNEEILFDTFSASIEGLDEWIGISGISVELTDDFKSFSIHFEQPATVNMVDSDGLSVNVMFGHTVPLGTEVTQASVKQNAYIKASTANAREPGYFISLFRRLTEFLSFAADETVSLHTVFATNSTISVGTEKGKSKPVNMSVYYGTANYVDTAPKLDLHRMLFRYAEISGSSQKILSSWLSLYENISPALNLYFATRAGAYKYMDSRFLSLAQALETLHRRTTDETVMSSQEFDSLLEVITKACPQEHSEWLMLRLAYGNEVSLGRRLKSLLAPFSAQFGSSKQREKLARMITDTRNYLTHYDDLLSDKAAKGRDLWVVSQKMEALLQLHLLRTLGFTDEQISTICSGPQSLSQKLKLEFGGA